MSIKIIISVITVAIVAVAGIVTKLIRNKK